jgi:hypothetical protein
MGLPIVATYRWSKDEFLRAQRHAIGHSRLARMVYWFTTAAGAVILLAGVVSLYQHSMAWPGFLFMVLFSALFFAMPLFSRRAALKLYAQKPDRDMEVTWTISEDGIRSKTPLALSENAWAFFQKAIRTREGFLLYPNTRMFYWLPMHAFHDTSDVERFAKLAESRVREYVEVG